MMDIEAGTKIGTMEETEMKMDEFAKLENFLGKAQELVDSMEQLDKMIEFIEEFPDSTILEIRGIHFPDDCLTKEGIEPIEHAFSDQHFTFSDEIKSDFISLLKNHRHNLEQKFDKMQLSQLDEYADEERN